MQPMRRKQTFWLIVQKNLWAMSLRSFLHYLLLTCIAWTSVWVYAAEPIINAAVNADETLLVTVQGKKATVWEIATGKKLYDVQMPEEDWSYKELENSGRIMVATFDPKNRWFAVGGVANGIYFFDIKSGILKKTVVPNVRFIEDICVSPNGNFLIDTFIGGLSIWDTTKWTRKHIKKDNKEHIPVGECLFMSNKRFMTASDNGDLDIFDVDGKNIITKKIARDVGDIHSISISADKDKFAVSFDNGEREFLFIGDTEYLSTTEINTDDINGTNFARSLSWGKDYVLFSAGAFGDRVEKFNIIAWVLDNSDNLRGRYMLGVSQGIIQKIISLKNGNFIIATVEPSWIELDKKGRILRYVRTDYPSKQFIF